MTVIVFIQFTFMMVVVVHVAGGRVGALRILAVADHGLFYGGADRLLRLP